MPTVTGTSSASILHASVQCSLNTLRPTLTRDHYPVSLVTGRSSLFALTDDQDGWSRCWFRLAPPGVGSGEGRPLAK